MGRSANGLSVKERRFVDAYLGSCGGNGTQAARAAGYKGNAKTLGVAAVRLLAKDRIRAVISKRVAVGAKKSILTAEERDLILSNLARNTIEQPFVKVAAIKELNKCSGRHSIKHVLDVTEKLSDIIAGSRAPTG